MRSQINLLINASMQKSDTTTWSLNNYTVNLSGYCFNVIKLLLLTFILWTKPF